jgi:hypothetical protein
VDNRGGAKPLPDPRAVPDPAQVRDDAAPDQARPPAAPGAQIAAAENARARPQSRARHAEDGLQRGDGADFSALAGDDQGAVAAFDAQYFDAGAGGFGVPQAVEGQEGDQCLLGRRPEPGGDQQGAKLIDLTDLQRDLFYRGLRVSPVTSAYVRVSAPMPRYAPYDRFAVSEKTSLSHVLYCPPAPFGPELGALRGQYFLPEISGWQRYIA